MKSTRMPFKYYLMDFSCKRGGVGGYPKISAKNQVFLIQKHFFSPS